jgi:hypothetical protein
MVSGRYHVGGYRVRLDETIGDPREYGFPQRILGLGG